MSYPAAHSFDNVTYPTLANGTLSQFFSVPAGAVSCVIFPPSGIGAWALQAAPPPDGDKTTVTSQALSYAAQPATDGATIEVTLTALSSGVAMAFDASMFGGGILQISGATGVATVDSLTIKVVWNIVGRP